MVRGQVLMNPAATTITNENVQVAIANGYPAGTANTATAAGLTNADYTIAASVAGAGINGNTPAIPVNGFVVIPNSVAGSPAALTCFISYTGATATVPPIVSNAPTTGC